MTDKIKTEPMEPSIIQGEIIYSAEPIFAILKRHGAPDDLAGQCANEILEWFKKTTDDQVANQKRKMN